MRTTGLISGLAIMSLTIGMGCLATQDDPVRRQFDFWLGDWSVNNRHLQADGSWKDTAKSVAKIQSICEGNAVLEQWTGIDGNRLIGFSVRTFDENEGKWIILLNWTSGGLSTFGRMVGTFRHGRGEFFPPGAIESGASQLQRYTFSDGLADSCRWDQANSTDGGDNWRTSWIMEFSRTGPATPVDASTLPMQMPPEKPYTNNPHAREFDWLIDEWTGDINVTENGAAMSGTVRLRASSMINGCGLLVMVDCTFEDGSTVSGFQARAYDKRRTQWVIEEIDSTNPVFREWAGRVEGEVSTFSHKSQDQMHRDRWDRGWEDQVTWTRETSTDGGNTWVEEFKAELNRQ